MEMEVEMEKIERMKITPEMVIIEMSYFNATSFSFCHLHKKNISTNHHPHLKKNQSYTCVLIVLNFPAL
jgi:hypothetical protein